MERSYRTKQRANILEFIKSNKDIHITADTIIEHFKNNGNPVGKATVYRYLENLVEENVIRKYIAEDNNHAACYQYIDDSSECQTHYHMKCTKCGALMHLKCEELSEISSHILKEHNFKIDICKTVLYGLCGNCMSNENVFLN